MVSVQGHTDHGYRSRRACGEHTAPGRGISFVQHDKRVHDVHMRIKHRVYYIAQCEVPMYSDHSSDGGVISGCTKWSTPSCGGTSQGPDVNMLFSDSC